MSTTDLAILGLLAEEPRHGYDLRAQVEHRGMSSYTPLTPGNLYPALRRLQREGYVEELREKRDRARLPRRVYRLTPAGRKRLDVLFAQALADPESVRLRVDTALALAYPRPLSEVRVGLARRREAQARLLGELRSRVPAVEQSIRDIAAGHGLDAARMLALGTSMIAHGIALAEAEIAWIDDRLAKLATLRKDDP